jgi:hypothetical protein
MWCKLAYSLLAQVVKQSGMGLNGFKTMSQGSLYGLLIRTPIYITDYMTI